MWIWLKLVTIMFYSVKGSSLWQLYFTPLKAQACDNYILLS
jgi:cytochrome b subunit of formate dehydrogenase